MVRRGHFFFSFGVGPAIFSRDMQKLLEAYYPSYSGLIVQVVIARYFKFGIVCAIIGIIHLLAEQFYFGRAPQKRWLGLLIALFVLTLLGHFWLQPKLNQLHTNKYAVNAPAQVRETATNDFKFWHGISQVANLAMLVGLGFYVVRVGSPRESTHFIGSGKFRS